jgi:hypothetical protein
MTASNPAGEIEDRVTSRIHAVFYLQSERRVTMSAGMADHDVTNSSPPANSKMNTTVFSTMMDT